MQQIKKSTPNVLTLEAETVENENQVNAIGSQNNDSVKGSFNQEAFIKMLKDIDPGRYYMQREEMDAFEVFRGKDFCLAVLLAFRWGFVRGQQAEKNRAKRARAKKGSAAA